MHTDSTVPMTPRWTATILTGTIIGFVVTVFAISLASLIFSGNLASELPRGIGIALMTLSISTILLSLLTSSSGIIASVQDSAAVIVAGITAVIASTMTPNTLPTVFVTIAGTTFITGLVFMVLGTFKLANLVRYLPYPIIGGFLMGTGALLLFGSIRIMTGVPMTPANLPGLFTSEQLITWLPGLAFGLVIFFSTRYFQQVYTLPLLLFIGLVLFYSVLFISGISIDMAIQEGFLLGDVGRAAEWRFFDFSQLGMVEWSLLSSQLGDIVVIFILTSMAVLLNISGIEVTIKEDIDLNHELRALGILNIVSALAGGMVGFHSVSQTTISHHMKARSRYLGVVVGVVPLLILVLGGSILAYIPKPLLGTLLALFGLTLSYNWAIEKRRSLTLVEYVTMLGIGFVIVAAGYLPGIILGLFVLVAMFIFDYSRTNIFYQILTGSEVSSNVERNAYHQRALRELGDHSYILKLQGFIFFGTANIILETAKTRLADKTRLSLDFLILDFRRVTGIDSSVVYSFTKLSYQAKIDSFKILLTGLSDTLEHQLAHKGIQANEQFMIFRDLDQALEWCEDMIITEDRITSVHIPTTLNLQLAERGFDKEYTKRLKPYLELVRLEPGDVLIQQGTEADSLYFIELGKVTVSIQGHDASPIRLQTLELGTLVGEIGFFLKMPRTATVVADQRTTAHRLTRENLEKLGESDPETAIAFKDLMLRVVSERLVIADRRIASLNQ